VERGTDLEEAVVWYYDAGMAADENLTEEEMLLGLTEGLDLAPLSASVPQKSSAGSRRRALLDAAQEGIEGRGVCT